MRSEKNLPKTVWFEITAEDMDRAKRFYSELFGWRIEGFPVPFNGDYLLIRTGNGHAISGGLKKRVWPNQKTVNYIGVSSADNYEVKVKDLGGRVVIPKTAVPGMGYFLVCLDTEDNAFGVWEDDVNAF
jgi:hypothetical protein